MLRDRIGGLGSAGSGFVRRLGAVAVAAAVLLAATGCQHAPWGKGPLAAVPRHRIELPPEPSVPLVVPQPEPPAEPPVRTVRLGQSVQGRPIVMHVFGEGQQPTFIFGGIHGNEPTSAGVAHRLVEHLRDHPELVRDRCVAVLPEANPDGLAKRTRTNARGVDLNRNFPAKNFRASKRHGPKPASEPETRAIMAAMERLRPARVVSIHSCGRGRHCNNYDGPAGDLARAMYAHNGYRVAAVWGAKTPGSLGSWCGIDRQIPTLTLELPNDLKTPQCWADNRQALLAVIQADQPSHAK